MEYKTIEGHKIKIGECYETRDGRKAFVCDFHPDFRFPVRGSSAHEDSLTWCENGEFDYGMSEFDLMRPWKEDKKLVVTDEMVNMACAIYATYFTGRHYHSKLAMQAAIQVVFGMVNSGNHVDDINVGDIKARQEEKPLDDGWIKHDGSKNPVREYDVEARFRNGEIAAGDSELFCCWEPDSEHDNGAWDIIAYRIISEPEKCECKNLKPGQIFQTTKDWKRRLCGELVNADKSTPKQTLLEFKANHPARNNTMLVMTDMMYVSEFLEKLEERLK